MRPARFIPPLAVLVSLSGAAADEVPWKERHELVVTPWPGLPDDPERYANAEVIWTDETSLVDCNAIGCQLRVFPFDEVCEDEVCQDLCPATSPFYAQPDPTTQCSGILVGEDLVLTAGHCLDPDDCQQKRIIFDYAVQFPGDPLGQPV
ncbi:MAG: trypsin-like serine protease, partial [Thermoanaerobaculia bacterium]